MPFSCKPVSLDDFVPDKDHDPLLDLLEVKCGTIDTIYLRLFKGTMWLVDDTLMPRSVRTAFESQKQSFPNSFGMKVDQADLHEPMLFSAAGYGWRGIWRSALPVLEIQPVDRVLELRSNANFGIVENH